MLKTAKSQLADIFRCLKYFFAFAWKQQPIYYFYVISGIILNSIEPFISILGMRYLIDEIAYQNRRDWRVILFWAGFICVGTWLYGVLNKYVTERQWYCNEKFDRIINLQLSGRTMKMKFEYTENAKMLDKIKRAERAFTETDLIQGMMGGLINIISGIFVLCGVFYLVISCSALLLIPVLVSFSVTTVVTMYTTKNRERYYEIYSQQEREQDYYMETLTESRYAKDIRIYDASPMILKNQAGMGERIYREAKKYSYGQWRLQRVDIFVMETCNLLVYIILGIHALFGKITVGGFSSLVQSVTQFKESMKNISQGIFSLKYDASILKYFLDYMEIVDEEEDSEKEYALPLPKIEGAPTIEFRNVSFKYPNTDVWILKNVSTNIHAGEHLSIVGKNGAGKTTFIKLLCRLYKVSEGEILLNGVNINQYRFRDYIRLLSVVFQDYKLMAFSVLENLAFEYSLDDGARARVRELWQLMGLDAWIGSLEKKEDTSLYKMFDKEGIEPSGGQAQKLAIARALYKNAPVVILDEPTAALDPMAEYEVYQHFDTLVGGKTAVYISHRLSSCKFCDRIIVFEGGHIIEDGSHEELMRIPDGFYAKMYRTQAKHYNETGQKKQYS